MDQFETFQRLGKMRFADGSPKGPITVGDLIRHVPGYAELFEVVKRYREEYSHRVRGPFHLLTVKLDDQLRVKDRFEKLIGWLSDHPDPWVRTSWAHEVGLNALLRATLGEETTPSVQGTPYGGE
jgi:hypothetical protein